MAEVNANLVGILEEKAACTVAIFDRGDHMCCYGVDAQLVARNIFKSTAMLKNLKSGGMDMQYLILNQNQYANVVRQLLLSLQHRVELYETETTHKGVNSIWKLTTKASPGNTDDFEELLSESVQGAASCGVMAVKIGNESADTGKTDVAVGFCDPTTYTFVVAEFCDTPHLTNLESLMVILSPRECLVISQDHSMLDTILSRSNILKTEQKKDNFSLSSIEQDLNRLIKFGKGTLPNSKQLAQFDLVESMCCVSACIRYVGLLSDSGYCNRFCMRTFVFGEFVRLDSSAVVALELLYSADGRTEGSLFSLLNYTKTPGGRKLLAQWIRQPLTDVNKIKERSDIVERLVNDPLTRSTLHSDIMPRIPDLNKMERRLARKKASLQDMYRVYQVVRLNNRLKTTLQQLIHSTVAASVNEFLVEPLQDASRNMTKFVEMIETTLDMEAVDKSQFRVNSSVDPKLTELKEQLDVVDRKMDKIVEDCAFDLGLSANKSVRLVNAPDSGMCLRVTKKDERCLREGKAKYNVLDSSRGGVRFSTVALDKLNEKYIIIKQEYDEAQQHIVDSMANVAAGYCDPLRRLSVTLSTVDVLVSLAVSAVCAPIPYTRPNIHHRDHGMLSLKDCRHPCLEVLDGISFIPNDVDLVKGKHDGCIISGPNMGGKSTYIRSVAINVLMAQMGAMVACSEANVSVVDAIYTRVGAGDNEGKGISTFMSEMIDSAVIIDGASKHSLVVFDELGRGTSTYDGFGLAYAIAEHMAKEVGCYMLFATHFHELATLAEELSNVFNVHVAAHVDKNKLTLLYKVAPGTCDKSFGINVAQMVKFPPQIIENAQQMLVELEKTQLKKVSV